MSAAQFFHNYKAIKSKQKYHVCTDLKEYKVNKKKSAQSWIITPNTAPLIC